MNCESCLRALASPGGSPSGLEGGHESLQQCLHFGVVLHAANHELIPLHLRRNQTNDGFGSLALSRLGLLDLRLIAHKLQRAHHQAAEGDSRVFIFRLHADIQ